MKKFIKMLLVVMVTAISVGMFTKEAEQKNISVQAEQMSAQEKELQDVKKELADAKEKNSQAEKITTINHFIIDKVDEKFAYALAIDDYGTFEENYVVIEKEDYYGVAYKQGDIVTISFDGFGELGDHERTKQGQLEMLNDGFGGIIESYKKGFEAEKPQA